MLRGADDTEDTLGGGSAPPLRQNVASARSRRRQRKTRRSTTLTCHRVMELYRKMRRARRSTTTFDDEDDDSDLETIIERRERWRSVYIIYFTMFLMSLGFSIILTGVWPYLDKLDPTAGKEFMGYVVAANPLGQMLFSPLVGWWGNKRGSVSLPLLTTLALFVVSSVGYSILEVIPSHRKVAMVTARFFVGVSSANIAVARSYLSAATKLSERTHAVSMVSLAQVLGFVVGPGLQAAVTPLGDEGLTFLGLPFNMYTMAGWINAILGIVNFILLLPWNFKERKIAAREAMRDQGKSTEKETWQSTRPDYLTTWTLICAFFVMVFNFVLLETLGTSLTMDQFAWTKTEALYYMGLLMSVGAVVACAMFILIGPLCKRFAERKVMLWGGFFFMIIGRIICIPWGPNPPKIAEMGPFGNVTRDVNGTEILGCPSTQEWCRYTPRMTVTQFFIGYGFTTVGYPIGVSLIQTIFSKVLGPRPQGVWMGLMTGAGCASRVMGPIFVGLIYTRYGTYHTFGITGVMLVAAMIWLGIVNKRLVSSPISLESERPSKMRRISYVEQKDVFTTVLTSEQQQQQQPLDVGQKEVEIQTLFEESLTCDKNVDSP